jgi:hypothetical protein
MSYVVFYPREILRRALFSAYGFKASHREREWERPQRLPLSQRLTLRASEIYSHRLLRLILVTRGHIVVVVG